jgi:MoaA/NifB/PqqE/SkfB family radical SAM enzyme
MLGRRIHLPVRGQYVRVAARAIAAGRLEWVARQALKTAAVPVADLLGRPLAGPILGNLVLTYRCNNTCFMCDLPKPWFYKARGPQGELDTRGMKNLIDEFAALKVSGLGFTGGEPTLRKDCLELLEYSRGVGLFSHLNTNAYRLHERARVEELLATGVESMNISLDGARPETHDRLRGAPNGFLRVAQATEWLLALRKNKKPSVTYTFVVGPENHTEIPDFLALARARGVDSVSFIPLHASYKGAQGPTDSALRAIERSVEALIHARNETYGELVDNSEAYLRLFPRSLRGEGSPLKCFAGYEHVLVDCYGNVYACAYHYETGRVAGNALEKPLRELWWSEQYQALREELSACRECFWNCHTEMNLLHQRAPSR